MFVPAMPMPSPSATKIRETRIHLGYTQGEAATLLHSSIRAWQFWESGARKMHPGLWELFVVKVGLHPLYRGLPEHPDSKRRSDK
jgi:DNA (cytosine-5)-methyltransferase 1